MQNQNAVICNPKNNHQDLPDLSLVNAVSQNAATSATLHQQFLKLGREKHRIEYQLLQLLPAIFESGIYKKYAHTIEGYAWRFAQLSASVVQKRLRLEKHLENKPALKAAIAKVGVHKVALVASIATAETDAVFADKVLNMSKPAVQELSKELRDKGFGEIKQGNLQTNLLDMPDFDCKDQLGQQKALELKNRFVQKNGQEVQESLLAEISGDQIDLGCKARTKIIKLELDEELTFMFLKIKQEIGKDLSHQGTIRKIFEKMLEVQNVGREKKKKSTNKKEIANQLISDQRTEPIKSKVIPGDNLKNNQKALLNNKKSNFNNTNLALGSCPKVPTITILPGSKVEGDQNSLESPNSPRPTFESEPLNNKEEKSSELSQNLSNPTRSISPNTTSRHIPVHQKRLALSQSNNHCSYPNCSKPAEVFHHPARYSKTKNHNNIKPLCKIHHEFMHNSIVENEEKNAEKWQLNLNKVKDKLSLVTASDLINQLVFQPLEKHLIDNLYQEYRHKALT